MIVVEVLNRMGKVRERSQHDTFPVRVGRDYRDNDVVVDDDYVSPHHLTIEQDENGHAVVTDLGSENGLLLLPSRERPARAIIATEGLLRIGHTILRLRTPAFVLPPTRREAQYFDKIATSFSHAGACITILALTVAWLYFDAYWSEFSKTDWLELVLTPVWIMLGVGVWAGLWSMASKISQQTFSFAVHGCIACLALLAASWFEVAREYYVFAFAAEWSGRVLLWVMALMWVAALLWGHLRLCTLMSSRKLAINAIAIAGCVVGLSAVSWYTSTPALDAAAGSRPTLKPPAFQIAGEVTTEAFFASVARLREKVDASVDDE